MSSPIEFLHFVTTNKNKLREARNILGIEVIASELPLLEPQDSLEAIVKYKVEQAYNMINGPVMVDDVGLYLDAFLQIPGPFVKYFLPGGSPELILDMMAHQAIRSAKVKCGIGYKDSEREIILVSSLDCIISETAKGEGWGFDPIVIPKGHTQTFAEMGEEKKNLLSHRYLVLTDLKKELGL